MRRAWRPACSHPTTKLGTGRGFQCCHASRGRGIGGEALKGPVSLGALGWGLRDRSILGFARAHATKQNGAVQRARFACGARLLHESKSLTACVHDFSGKTHSTTRHTYLAVLQALSGTGVLPK